MLIATSLFAQKRALRIDSLRVNDNNVITDNGNYLLIDPHNIPVLISGAGGSYGGLYIDGNKTTGDLLRVINDNDGAVGDSTIRIDSRGVFFGAANKVYIDSVGIYGMDATDADTFRLYENGTHFMIDTDNPVRFNQKLLSWASKVYIDSTGIYGMDATDADTFRIYDSGDTTFFHSDNPVSFNSAVLFHGNISVGSITDRTEYVGEKKAIEILKKVNLSLSDDFKNEDDVFVLPYELRDKQYRDLSRCISLLLAVAKSQQAEIEKLKKKIK
jgi:hypothetical protein